MTRPQTPRLALTSPSRAARLGLALTLAAAAAGTVWLRDSAERASAYLDEPPVADARILSLWARQFDRERPPIEEDPAESRQTPAWLEAKRSRGLRDDYWVRRGRWLHASLEHWHSRAAILDARARAAEEAGAMFCLDGGRGPSPW